MAIETVNPATGELVEKFEEYSEGEIDRCLKSAEGAFKEWRAQSFAERGDLMRKAAEILKNDTRRLAEIITLEMGKPITQAIAEVEKCAWGCEYYAEHAESILAPKEIPTDGVRSYVRYDPLGPVLAVMPWNFPLWQVFRFAAPALMAGNVGVLKHSSNVPRCALEIEKVFIGAGFPEGVFTTLLISAPAVEKVIRDERIKAVTLTGSEAAGSKVAATAGEALKKTVLELGGSDPFIVLEDADMDRTAKMAAQARNINSGQTCVAAKRFIVVKDVIEEFTEKFKAALEKMRVGDPMDESTEIGPMARADLRDDLHDQVKRAVESGGKLLLGGEVPDGPGFFYPTTLITVVDKDSPVCAEETFGPVAAVIEAKDEKEAVEIANHTQYGLGSTIWTKDLDRAARLAPLIDAGMVFVNGMVKSDPRLPFGGIKRSGYGRELSEEGIKEFVNLKTVWMSE